MKQEMLKHLVHYNEETGIFTWKNPSSKANVTIGGTIGGLNNSGSLTICLQSKSYLAHKLAFIYMTGEAPKNIQHLNGIRTDNRWSNLTSYVDVPEGETTQEILNKFFSYETTTGKFTRILSTGRQALKGSIAGGVNVKGYIVIAVGKNRHYAHRLAFLAVTGNFPTNIVDHIDGNTSNNSWNNLREATYSQNGCNSNLRENHPTGVKGVTHSASGTYVAQIKLDGKVQKKNFKTLQEAEHFLLVLRAKVHGEFTNYG